jgi:hypothetical protein
MKPLPTLKILLLALLLADLGLSPVMAASSRKAFAPATTSEGASSVKSTSAKKSRHKNRKHQRRVTRKNRAHQLHHKRAASQSKSPIQAESPTQ